jgi:hypothetical protein
MRHQVKKGADPRTLEAGREALSTSGTFLNSQHSPPMSSSRVGTIVMHSMSALIQHQGHEAAQRIESFSQRSEWLGY